MTAAPCSTGLSSPEQDCCLYSSSTPVGTLRIKKASFALLPMRHVVYLSQCELSLELLRPDSCCASSRIFSMSPLWMEMEAGTCSWPVGVEPFPLPFPLLLKWSSTQEPAWCNREQRRNKSDGFVQQAGGQRLLTPSPTSQRDAHPRLCPYPRRNANPEPQGAGGELPSAGCLLQPTDLPFQGTG